MTKIKYLAIHVLIYIISYLFSLWLYQNYFYPVVLRFNRNIIGRVDFWAPMLHTLILSFWLYLFLQSLYTKKIKKILVYGSYLAYFGLLFSILFFNRGPTRGFNLNIFHYLSDFFTPLVFFNITMTIPIGFILKLNKKNILTFILAFTLVETLQYVLYLGFFDIGDILANTTGFIIGATIIESKFGKKIKEAIV